MPSLVPNAKRIIEEGMSVAGFGNVSGQTYESNVPFVLRYSAAAIYLLFLLDY